MATKNIGIKTHWDRKKRGGAPKRPYRLWDSKSKRNMPSRAYKYEVNALNGALLECKWMPVGATIEVYMVEGGRLIGVYKRHVNTVSFTK